MPTVDDALRTSLDEEQGKECLRVHETNGTGETIDVQETIDASRRRLDHTTELPEFAPRSSLPLFRVGHVDSYIGVRT